MKAQLDAVRLENHHLKEASFQGELRVKTELHTDYILTKMDNIIV